MKRYLGGDSINLRPLGHYILTQGTGNSDHRKSVPLHVHFIEIYMHWHTHCPSSVTLQIYIYHPIKQHKQFTIEINETTSVTP